MTKREHINWEIPWVALRSTHGYLHAATNVANSGRVVNCDPVANWDRVVNCDCIA
jgi:hypothetical protein